MVDDHCGDYLWAYRGMVFLDEAGCSSSIWHMRSLRDHHYFDLRQTQVVWGYPYLFSVCRLDCDDIHVISQWKHEQYS